MKIRHTFPVLFSVIFAYASHAFAEQADSPPQPFDLESIPRDRIAPWIPKWISRIEFRLVAGGGTLHMRQAPDFVRNITDYDLHQPHQLSDQPSGNYVAYSIGAGISFAKINWLELTYDISFRPSTYHRGRTTWNEMPFPPYDSYAGYEYHGNTSDLSIKIIPISFSAEEQECFQGYFKTGIRKHFGELSSGTDAWSSFHRQNQLPLNEFAYTMGGGGIFFGFLTFEYMHSTSFTDRPKVTDDIYLFGLIVSFVTPGWCKKPVLPSVVCLTTK
jgi:hypothetical protein